MDVAVLEQMLNETFDHAVVHHGYSSYMRDYEVIVHVSADPRTDVEPAYLRYLFKYCVEARCESSVPPDTWSVSLDDRLIDHETGVDLDGYVWGVKWHCLYPGARILPEPPTDEIPPAVVAAADIFDTWENLLAASLREHGVEAEQAAQLATLVVAAVEGTVAMCRAKRSTQPLDHTTEQLRALVISTLKA